MFAFIISVICFVLTVPLKVVIVFLKASNIALVAKDKQDIKKGKVDEESDSDESQLKGKLAVGKKAKKVINAKTRALISMNEIAIRSLKFLVRLLQLISLVMQVIGIFGLMIMFIVVIALLAAVAGCVTLVMSDGWQSASGGGTVTGGGGSQQSGGSDYAVDADTAKIIAMSDSEVWKLISEGKYGSYDEANNAAKANMEGEKAFWTGLLTSVEVPCWKFSGNDKVESTVTIKVNKHLAGYFKDFMTDLHNLPEKYVIVDIGGFSFRPKNNGSGTSNLSGHSFGAVLDINFSVDGMGSYAAGYGEKGKPWKTSNGLSDPLLSECCTFDNSWNSLIVKYQLDWGGNWSLNSLDPMHFSLVGDRNKDTRSYAPKWEGRTP